MVLVNNMPEIKTNENIIIDKSDRIDLTPNPVIVLRGNQIIGGVTQGNIEGANHNVENITKPLQSPNFKQGVKGWRLNSNGILEANGAVIT